LDKIRIPPIHTILTKKAPPVFNIYEKTVKLLLAQLNLYSLSITVPYELVTFENEYPS